MPIFHDVHYKLPLSQDQKDHFRRVIAEGVVDKHGVRQKGLLVNDEGLAVCILEAPDHQAVIDHHADLGLTCEPHEVEEL